MNMQSNQQKMKEHLKRELMKIPQPEREDWLRTLYVVYTQRFTSDNDRIWATGSIMIPLSLSGFALLPYLKDPSHLVNIAIPSILLMAFWLVIAENMRAFQNKSLAWIQAIEAVKGMEDTGSNKVEEENRLYKTVTFKGAVQFIRWLLLAVIIVAWIGFYFFWKIVP